MEISHVQFYETIPHGWKPITGASTAPVGYEWISNGKSRFSKDYKIALVKGKFNDEKNYPRTFPTSISIKEEPQKQKEHAQQAKLVSVQFSNEPGIGESLNRLAREEMKYYLLKDILRDITVCKLEGWEYKNYLRELQQIIGGFLDSDGKIE